MNDGSLLLFVPPALFLIFVIWFIGTYNSLVRLRNYCQEAWGQIETELKRRYDLIPNLVSTVKGYAAHERDVLERVIQARTAAQASHGTPGQQATDENQFIQALRQIFALAEAYPQLRSDRNFLELQRELANTEDRIQAARRFYNANVRDLNTRTEIFPSNIVAGLFNFSKKEYFEVEDSGVRNAPAVEIR